jgi:hypothetical protein
MQRSIISLTDANGTRDRREKTEDWQVETGRGARSRLAGEHAHSGGRVMIGQTFTLVGNPKLVFRLVWRGSSAGIDCVRGVALNGKFQTLRPATDVVFVEAA